jgi:rSAM/selenodomain-associated transferase 2
MRISLIIPTLNEATVLPALAESLGSLSGFDDIIVADGGSRDATIKLALQQGWRVIRALPGRGTQMNAAASLAQGEVLLFLHADTRLPAEAAACIQTALNNEKVGGGNFSLLFDGNTQAARWLTRLYPFLRFGGMCYGDSAIFIRRTVFEKIGGYRDFPLFEDLDLYRRMKRHGQFVRLSAQAQTSSRRFEGSFIRTFARWAGLQILYWLGVSPVRLAKFYRPVR